MGALRPALRARRALVLAAEDVRHCRLRFRQHFAVLSQQFKPDRHGADFKGIARSEDLPATARSTVGGQPPHLMHHQLAVADPDTHVLHANVFLPFTPLGQADGAAQPGTDAERRLTDGEALAGERTACHDKTARLLRLHRWQRLPVTQLRRS